MSIVERECAELKISANKKNKNIVEALAEIYTKFRLFIWFSEKSNTGITNRKILKRQRCCLLDISHYERTLYFTDMRNRGKFLDNEIVIRFGVFYHNF